MSEHRHIDYTGYDGTNLRISMRSWREQNMVARDAFISSVHEAMLVHDNKSIRYPRIPDAPLTKLLDTI